MTHLITSPTGRRVASAEESAAYLRDCAARADADALRCAVADTVRQRKFPERPVDRHDMLSHTLRRFASITAAADDTGCHATAVYHSMRMGYLVRKRWKFSKPGRKPLRLLQAHNRRREGATA